MSIPQDHPRYTDEGYDGAFDNPAEKWPLCAECNQPYPPPEYHDDGFCSDSCADKWDREVAGGGDEEE